MSRARFEFKVVICGPFGVGKTTMIKSISNVPVVGTEVATTGDEAAHKLTTTVGLEYGQFDVSAGEFDIRLLLYGTPGQERFRFMWEILAVGADACVVLADATAPTTWDEARTVLEFFRGQDIGACAIGANRGLHDATACERLGAHLGAGDSTPVVPCDVTDPRSARDLLVAVFELLAPSNDDSSRDHDSHHTPPTRLAGSDPAADPRDDEAEAAGRARADVGGH